MKKVITLFAILAAAFVMSPQVVEAGHGSSRSSVYTYVSGRSSCGCAIYTKRVFCHYDRYGHPVYTYHRQPVTHRCSQYRSSRGHGHGYGHSSHRPVQYQYYRGSSRGSGSVYYRNAGRHAYRGSSRSSCGY